MGIRKLLPAAGLVVLCTGANPHDDYGGYKPASNVIEHSQISLDIEAFTTAVNKEDWTTAKKIYTDGRYSCKTTSKTRTLQGFVSASTVTGKLTGQAYWDSQITGAAGPNAAHGVIPGAGRLGIKTSYWDDFIVGALDGTGDFSGLSTTMRKVAANKGILGVLTVYTGYELEASIKKAVAGSTTDDKGAPHNWDEGWVFYYGSHKETGKTAYSGKYGAWEFTYKRDTDYTSTGAAKGATQILKYFLEGLKASRTGTVDTAKMIESRNNIYRIFALSAIRAALKYSYLTQYNKAGTAEYSETYHMEAYAYYLSAAGWIAQADETAAKAVLALLDFKKAKTALNADLYCAVKKELIPVYTKLGLDCLLVGTYKSLPSTKTCTGLPTCPTTTTLPAGLASYVPDTTTTKGANMDCGYSLLEASMASARSLWAAWALLGAGLAAAML